MNRFDDLRRFYENLERLTAKGGLRTLPEVLASPVGERGVYFFFEPGENRSDSGRGLRVVRVGTHALNAGASSTLRGRLRQHGGSRSAGGNHRGSIFRLLTGDALARCGIEQVCPSWGVKHGKMLGIDRASIKQAERAMERAVSLRLATTSVAWLDVGDLPGPESLRGWIERNAIALLSNDGKAAIDPASPKWLGHHSSRPRVRASGLWNQNHVDEPYNPAFLDDLQRLVEAHISQWR